MGWSEVVESASLGTPVGDQGIASRVSKERPSGGLEAVNERLTASSAALSRQKVSPHLVSAC